MQAGRIHGPALGVCCLIGAVAWGCRNSDTGGASDGTLAAGGAAQGSALTLRAAGDSDVDDTLCGNQLIDFGAGEECDDGDGGNGNNKPCTDRCKRAACGDGLVCSDPACGAQQLLEECDDGGENSDAPNAACRTNCLPKRCGDGVRDGGEECDDGNTNANDDCTDICRFNSCGDGEVNETEDGDGNRKELCDDGNTVNGDSCPSDCLVGLCGNGVTDEGEQCDNGEEANGWDADCLPNCWRNVCGDGHHNTALDEAGPEKEACDEGGQNSDAWSLAPHCNATCTGLAPYCGDDEQNGADEECDDGERNSDAWSLDGQCKEDCTDYAPHCGDGFVEETTDEEGVLREECDDGNRDLEDCSYGERSCSECGSTCEWESGGNVAYCGDGEDNGPTEETEACDSGDGYNTHDWRQEKHCNEDCSDWGPYCGDGNPNGPEVDGAEVCDSGEDNTDDYRRVKHCNATCTDWGPYCGDNTPNGEEVCDEGEGKNSDAWAVEEHCNTTCSGYAPYCGDDTKDPEEECEHHGVVRTRCEYGALSCELCGSECKNAEGETWYCGDTVRQNPPEKCDEGPANGTYNRCKADCTGIGPHCNDGNCDPQEQSSCGTCPGDCAGRLTCSDGNSCTHSDTCQANGTCVGTAVICNDNNPCTTDSCVNGACSYVAVTNGTSCGSCMECRSGQCRPEPAGESCGTCRECNGSGSCRVAAGASCRECGTCSRGGSCVGGSDSRCGGCESCSSSGWCGGGCSANKECCGSSCCKLGHCYGTRCRPDLPPK